MTHAIVPAKSPIVEASVAAVTATSLVWPTLVGPLKFRWQGMFVRTIWSHVVFLHVDRDYCLSSAREELLLYRDT